MKTEIVLFCCVIILTGCGTQNVQPVFNSPNINQTIMGIKSSAYVAGELLPAQFTCDGEDVNPPLSISGVPERAVSLALIFDDPDAPAGTWVHWLAWNIDPATAEISANSVPTGSVLGTTSFGTTGYGGPCPPSGTHRYIFKLYALDTKLDLPNSAKAADLEKTMAGHVLAQAQLVGKYAR